MRIAQCLEYPLALRGGVSVLVESLATELVRKGHEIALVSPDSMEDLQRHGFDQLFRRHLQWDPNQASFATAKRLAGQLTAEKIDIAHFHAGGNYGWGNRFPFFSPPHHLNSVGIRSIWTSHLVVDLLNGFCGPQKPAWFKLMLLPLAWSGKMQQLRNVSFEIAVSQHDYAKLRRWYWPLRDRIIQVYHARISGAVPALTGERQKVILNVGHIAWRKGQAILVQAFTKIAANHPDWKLQLAGDCSDKNAVAEIRAIIDRHQLGGRVSLLGERTDVFDLMRQAAIYVQPSFWEALGLALQEAMLAGCACIGSRTGGIPELISDKQTGLLVEPGNVSELSEKLNQLISSPERCAQLGAAAGAAIQNKGMTVEAMTQRYLDLYESA